MAFVDGLTIHHSDTSLPADSSVSDASGPDEPSSSAQPVKMVSYSGNVEHLSVPCLTAFPELAFDGEGDHLNNFLLTAKEFKQMLSELYQNGYMLVDVHDLYAQGTDGFQRKDLQLPEGKKPLILSVDDVSYHADAAKGGTSKLVLDQNGKVASSLTNPQGEIVVSRDYEVFPIVDQFVEEHPDFSLNGAKGIIGLTGYDGVVGYRTRSTSDAQDAQKVLHALSQSGWRFACNTYSRMGYGNASAAQIKSDLETWSVQVQPLTGVTDILLFPFGSWPEHGSDAYRALTDAGYRYFYSSGMGYYERCYDGYVFQDRKNICGYSLNNHADSLSGLFNAQTVLDRTARA
ncbi:MAG: hypothetical protein HFE85_03000 [Clostridiales bacterium]|nr:hypothetical protein [Clostridiales bacterium]